MSDSMLRAKAREGIWDPDLALRHGLITSGEEQKALALYEANCSHPSCPAPLQYSTCSYCATHRVYFDGPSGGSQAARLFRPWILLHATTSNCACCHQAPKEEA